jgi:2-polyprenyl-6-methoxyphenol hydroxylase-like FAD-dependent oxidoreductase
MLRLGMNVKILERRREDDLLDRHGVVILTPNAQSSLTHIDERLARVISDAATVIPAAHLLTPQGKILNSLSSSDTLSTWKHPLLAITQSKCLIMHRSWLTLTIIDVMPINNDTLYRCINRSITSMSTTTR